MSDKVRVFRHPKRNLWAPRPVLDGLDNYMPELTVRDARFVVDETRRQRLLRGECRRFGHAWVEGWAEPGTQGFMPTADRGDYDYERGHFYINMVPDEPLSYATVVVFTPSGMWLPLGGYA